MDKAAYKVAIEAEKWMMEAERLKAQLLFRDTTMLPEKDAEIESLRSDLQKQKELNAELVKGLEYIKKLLGTLSVAQDTTEGQAYYTAESLIKKSKES